MLIAGPIGAAVAYVWMAVGHYASLLIGVVGPMALLGISFAALVAPLTTSILSGVGPADEGLAAAVNNAISRVAQLTGIALAAGVASFVTGYEIALAGGAVVTGAAAMLIAATVPPS
jgi:hypothetical protein